MDVAAVGKDFVYPKVLNAVVDPRIVGVHHEASDLSKGAKENIRGVLRGLLRHVPNIRLEVLHVLVDFSSRKVQIPFLRVERRRFGRRHCRARSQHPHFNGVAVSLGASTIPRNHLQR